MYRVGLLRCSVLLRRVVLPWQSTLPPPSHPQWAAMGKAVVELARSCDTGAGAFEECLQARAQLESVVQSIGHDVSVYIFGGLVTLGMLEVGGDVDFVGVADVEPGFEEAGEIIVRLSRELRRYGLRSRGLPKARVPVIKADRVSRTVPGTPLSSVACDGVFHFARPVSAAEAGSFERRLREHHTMNELEWNASHQIATARFGTTVALMHAITHVTRHAEVDIPLRMPVDPRAGPELYRIPFDFCLSSTGLRNSYYFAELLSHCVYARHLLLVLKKWGRASGVINSIDGLLASYALTVMMGHFLRHVGAVPKVAAPQVAEEPHLLLADPPYRPLAAASECPLDEVGYMLGAFLEYYGGVFDYAQHVVCAANTKLTKHMMRWDANDGGSNPTTPLRPPFFHFCIKDPYGLDNIARNLDADATRFVREAHASALQTLLRDAGDPAFAVNNLVRHPPRPQRRVRSLDEQGIHSDHLTQAQLEARSALHKLQFHERKHAVETFGQRAARNSENQHVASTVAQSVLGWIKSDEPSPSQ